jgi:hypothetical protein
LNIKSLAICHLSRNSLPWGTKSINCKLIQVNPKIRLIRAKIGKTQEKEESSDLGFNIYSRVRSAGFAGLFGGLYPPNNPMVISHHINSDRPEIKFS